MINEYALRDTILALAEQAKANYTMICSINDEVAALRERLRALDPTFDDALKGKPTECTTADSAACVLRGYAKMIQRLKDNLVW